MWNLYSMKKAKVFMNGRSQAVRLPREFRFDCDEVFVERQGENVILSPSRPNWDEFLDSVSTFGDDFMSSRQDPPPQDGEFF